MKIRTIENLYDTVTKDITWRKKELSDFRTLIEGKSMSNSKRDALLRAGITLLYAHWEGFIKSAACAYLEYVSRQGLRYEELTPNFIAVCMKKELNEAQTSNKAIAHNSVVNFFLCNLTKKSSIPYKNVINTQSNLSSTVLQNIINTLGFDYTFYETKEKLLDEKLLDSRNNIAHGRYLEIDIDSFKQMHEKVLEMMEFFRNQIDNSATMKSYKRP